MYPLSPSLELDLEDEEKEEEEDSMVNKNSIASTKTTRLQSSAYREKSGHIAASS